MANWQVGQTVVCVYNGFLDEADAPELEEGESYTVVAVLPPRRGHVGLQIAGIAARQRFRAFDERRFIPIQSAVHDLLHRIVYRRTSRS